MTPEEYEAIVDSVEELKANCKVYALEFTTFSLAFTYWQRRFVPRSFFLFAAVIGSATGIGYGLIRTGWYFAEKVDQLGRDYEISRVMKQDIFDSRPDLDSSTRASYYMYQ